VTAKLTVTELGLDPAAQVWQRSGTGAGAIEVAFARTPASPAAQASRPAPASPSAEWVLMRVAGDPQHRVLVFDRHEWECFLDGARKGEFDAAAAPSEAASI
jgi:Domain of unknown function (DUF397)